MRLLSRDGASIEIRPTAYQFSANPRAQVGTDWDANWLVVRGDVKTASGFRWTFVDPCLTTWEARELAAWLRGVVDGLVAPAHRLVQQCWAPSVHRAKHRAPFGALVKTQRARVRFHFSLDALPPWLDGRDRPGLFEYLLVFDVSTKDLAAAAEECDDDCKPFPVR